MNATATIFDTSLAFTAGSESQVVLPRGSFSVFVGNFSDEIPVSIPRDQFFFWSRVWQDAERENLEQLARGEGKLFKNSDDAIRWLFEAE